MLTNIITVYMLCYVGKINALLLSLLLSLLADQTCGALVHCLGVVFSRARGSDISYVASPSGKHTGVGKEKRVEVLPFFQPLICSRKL